MAGPFHIACLQTRPKPDFKCALAEAVPLARFGHAICYDLRFPGLFRDLESTGAEIILMPAVFTRRAGKAQWCVLNRARAVDNGVFIVAPCAIGLDRRRRRELWPTGMTSTPPRGARQNTSLQWKPTRSDLCLQMP